jgi:hypothetical protein
MQAAVLLPVDQYEGNEERGSKLAAGAIASATIPFSAISENRGGIEKTWLRLFWTGSIAASILAHCTPSDAIDLLQTKKELYHYHVPWLVILHMLNLQDCFEGENARKYKLDDHPRTFVIHTIRKLGFNCTQCYTVLDGQEGDTSYDLVPRFALARNSVEASRPDV